MLKKIIGIDIGNNNISIAYIENNIVKIIKENHINNSFPNLIQILKNKKVLIGSIVKKNWIYYPENTINCIKKLFYINSINDLNNFKKNVLYKININQNNKLMIQINDFNLSLKKILSFLFKKIKLFAEKILNTSINYAYLSSVIEYDDFQLSEIIDAGKIAGLNIINIIKEPLAIILGFFSKLQNINFKTQKVAIYSLGGMFFNFSIIKTNIYENEASYEFLANETNDNLGGEIFNNRIFNFINNLCFLKFNIIIYKNYFLYLKIKEQIEVLKQYLSNKFYYKMEFYIYQYKKFKKIIIHFSRKFLELLLFDIIKKTFIIVKNVLNNINIQKNDLSTIIITGKTTLMPFIQQQIKIFFNQKIYYFDNGVVIGTAIMSNMCFQNKLNINYIKQTIGIEIENDKMLNIFKKNSLIPIKRSICLSNMENLKNSIIINVLEGENKQASLNKLLKSFNLYELIDKEDLKKEVELFFEIKKSNILQLSINNIKKIILNL